MLPLPKAFCVSVCLYVCIWVGYMGLKIFLTQYNQQETIWQTGSRLFILILFGG